MLLQLRVALSFPDRAEVTLPDCINVAARQPPSAGPGEVVVSNSFFQALGDADRGSFREVELVEGKNVGRIKAWILTTEP